MEDDFFKLLTTLLKISKNNKKHNKKHNKNIAIKT
jgi:hypothetical protein